MSNISAIRADIYNILRGYGVADTLIEALRRIESCATDEEINRINYLSDIHNPYMMFGLDVPDYTPNERQEAAEREIRDIFIRRFVRGMDRADLLSLLNTILHNTEPVADVYTISLNLFGSAVKAVSLTDLADAWNRLYADAEDSGEKPILLHNGDDYPV